MSNLKLRNAMTGCATMMDAMKKYLCEFMDEVDAYIVLRGMMCDTFSDTVRSKVFEAHELDELEAAFRLEYEELIHGKE